MKVSLNGRMVLKCNLKNPKAGEMPHQNRSIQFEVVWLTSDISMMIPPMRSMIPPMRLCKLQTSNFKALGGGGGGGEDTPPP